MPSDPGAAAPLATEPGGRGSTELIVLTMSSQPRDELLALNVATKFSSRRTLWIRLAPANESKPPSPFPNRLKNALRTIRHDGFSGLIQGWALLTDRPGVPINTIPAELALFGATVEEMRQAVEVQTIECSSIESATEIIRMLAPRLLVTNAGASLARALCKLSKVVNLHLGMPPYLRSAYPSLDALYHRDPRAVGACFSFFPSGPDEEIICYPTAAQLAPEDTLEDCLARSALVGANAISNALHPLLADDPPANCIRVLPSEAGHSWPEKLRLIRTDLRNGLVRRYLQQRAKW